MHVERIFRSAAIPASNAAGEERLPPKAGPNALRLNNMTGNIGR